MAKWVCNQYLNLLFNIKKQVMLMTITITPEIVITQCFVSYNLIDCIIIYIEQCDVPLRYFGEIL